MKIFAYIIIGIVVIAVAASFFVIGTPGNERLRRIDDARVNHLSTIQNEIQNFWARKDSLPAALNELENDISYFTVPTDPETNAQYEYKVSGQYQFELCANFTTDNKGEFGSSEFPKPMYPYGYESKWSHGVGRTCFTRTIDPELYKIDAGKTHVPAASRSF